MKISRHSFKENWRPAIYAAFLTAPIGVNSEMYAVYFVPCVFLANIVTVLLESFVIDGELDLKPIEEHKQSLSFCGAILAIAFLLGGVYCGSRFEKYSRVLMIPTRDSIQADADVLPYTWAGP